MNERLRQAVDEERYRDACTQLVSFGFSQTVCDWILATIEGESPRSLMESQLRAFLREQHVRRIGGRVIGWYDEANNEYEVRVGGRTAILVATETAFETTGRFSMWAQDYGTSEEVLNSGRLMNVKVYREWPLFQAIVDAASVRGSGTEEAAVKLLQEIARGWLGDYCYKNDPFDIQCAGETSTQGVESASSEAN